MIVALVLAVFIVVLYSRYFRLSKGGKAPTRMHAALLLKDESGVPNKQVQEILAGKGGLPLAIP